MNRMNASVAVAVAWVLLAGSASALAQSNTTYASALGSDANPCDRTTPCRSIGAALAAVTPNGEVIVLDSGDYPPVTIDKAVSIVAARGVQATIVQAASAGVVVNAPEGAVVVLRGLTIRRVPTGFGGRGLTFNSAAELHVEDCVIEGSFADGVRIGGPAPSRVYMVDTVVRGAIDEKAIDITGSSRTSLERVRVESTALVGLTVGGAAGATDVRVTIRDSSFTKTTTGIHVESGGRVTIENSVFSSHGTALYANPGGQLRVSNSLIVDNTRGVGGTGTRMSFGNNRMVGNTSNGTFSAVLALR